MPPNSPHAPPRHAPRRLVVATSNAGKLREFRSLLEGVHVAGAPYELVSLADVGVASPEESGSSFLANAVLKARHAASLSGEAALADDSGLEVDALDGAPGIYSARYAAGGQQPGQSMDAANNAKLLRELAGVPWEHRTARYRCALVLIDARLDAPLIAEDTWEGYVLDAPQGTGGFGYDAYFWLPGLQLTAAQLSSEDKNRLSHRGKAMRALRDMLLSRDVTQ
jgi:XTP/dITP diphosphohydrolase